MIAIAIGVWVMLCSAPAAHAQTTMLTSSDFTLSLARRDTTSTAYIALDTTGLATYFSAARCSCPTSVLLGLGLTDDGAAKLASTDTLDATVMVGSDCDNLAATACQTLASVLTLDPTTTSSSETLSTADLFSAAEGGAACSALPSTSTRIWAIVRLNGVRLTTQPSLAIGLGGAAPVAPTAVTLETADSGLLVSWTAVADLTRIQGYQVLCSPGPATPPAAAYETCAETTPTTATGLFTPLDARFICSALVDAGSNSVRVHGLTNGATYQVAVISIGNDGTPSAPSTAVQGSPGPTLGFDDIYKESGGTAQAGCAIAGRPDRPGGAGWMILAAIAGALGVRSRSRSRCGTHARRARRARAARAMWLAPLLIAPALMLAARAAHADEDDDATGFTPPSSFVAGQQEAATPSHSPRHWNMELRMGPYRPAIDSEFADRGQAARPFEETFSSARHLMSQIEIDRQLAHQGGTWAVGISGGLYRVSARAFADDHVTRSGDDTSLRIIPLSVSLVYRADVLHQRTGFPLVPYAKAGLDCALWSIADTAKSSAMSGRTLGWHGAAGVSLDLSFLDPESAHTMDMESGVNQFALFFEFGHYALDGFGSSSALRVGDTTWLAGIMMEL